MGLSSSAAVATKADHTQHTRGAMGKKDKNQRGHNSSSGISGNQSGFQGGAGDNVVARHGNNLIQVCTSTLYSYLASPIVQIFSNPDDRNAVLCILFYVLLGVLLGMGVGSGFMLGNYGSPPTVWRIKLGAQIRDSLFYNIFVAPREPVVQVYDNPHLSSSFSRSTTTDLLSSQSQYASSSSSSLLTTDTAVDFAAAAAAGNGLYHQILQAAAMSLAAGGELSEAEHDAIVQKYTLGINHQRPGAGTTMASNSYASKMWQNVISGSGSPTNGPNNNKHKRHGTKTATLPIVHRTYSQAFYTLREMVIRDDYGYVHSDLGMLSPAPCGADRGLGMVSSRYHECQVTCSPGTSIFLSKNNTKSQQQSSSNSNSTNINDDVTIYHLPKGWYPQEEILIRVPLSVQMTRVTAIKTLRNVIPEEVLSRAPLEELDDAFLLALQLAHEHGRGRESRWHPYIATFPSGSQCGYAPNIRTSAIEMVSSLGATYGLDVNGWPAEIQRAYNYAEQIASSLAQNYGMFIAVAKGVNVLSLLQWALCHVSSRAIGGRELDNRDGLPAVGPTSKRKSLRLVPLMDMINHDVTAGMAQELTINTEGSNNNNNGLTSSLTMEDGKKYLNIQENERGAFIIRNMRHGKVLPLTKGQELLMNYNVPEYSALDWFLLMAFVPPERMERWVKVESALPRVRVQHPSTTSTSTTDGDNHAVPPSMGHTINENKAATGSFVQQNNELRQEL